MRLSKNFTLEEFERSQTAKRLDLDNSIPPEYIPNVKALVDNVLQPLRDAFGEPIMISSGYRNPTVNGIIGGSKNSSHCRGEAADFTIKGIDNIEVAEWIENNCQFDQLILEFYSETSPNGGWVHCSYRRKNNRQQTLTAVKHNGKTVYLPGLPKHGPSQVSK